MSSVDASERSPLLDDNYWVVQPPVERVHENDSRIEVNDATTTACAGQEDTDMNFVFFLKVCFFVLVFWVVAAIFLSPTHVIQNAATEQQHDHHVHVRMEVCRILPLKRFEVHSSGLRILCQWGVFGGWKGNNPNAHSNITMSQICKDKSSLCHTRTHGIIVFGYAEKKHVIPVYSSLNMKL